MNISHSIYSLTLTRSSGSSRSRSSRMCKRSWLNWLGVFWGLFNFFDMIMGIKRCYVYN